MVILNPAVSIITASYNSEGFISEAIESVIAQTFTDWELIIVDDQSVDDSVATIKRYLLKDNRIKLIQLAQNSGAAVARNTAIEESNGRYIAFLDSDDLWLPEKLEIQLAFMQKHDYPFTFSAYERIDENGESLGFVGVPEKTTYREMLKTSVIGCLTAMYDTRYFGKMDMPLIRKRQDYGLWLKLLRQTKYAYGIQQPLARYRIRRYSISSNKLKTSTYNWRLYRQVEKLSLPLSCYYFVQYAIRGVLRTRLPKLARKLGVMD